MTEHNTSPVLSPDAMRALAQQIFELTTAKTESIDIEHIALGTAHVARGAVQITESGDYLRVGIGLRFGQRTSMSIDIDQIDTESLRQAVRYLERVAMEQTGDPVEIPLTIPPRTYFPNTTWHSSTVSAFNEERHAAVETLVAPVRAAGLTTSAFVGVTLRSVLHANKQGIMAVGQETDSEVAVTAWNPNGKGNGWAGQAARDWTTHDLTAVSDRAIHLTKLAANPVGFEPGRRTVILDRSAVAEFLCDMGWAFGAKLATRGGSPLYDPIAGRARLGQRIFDPRVTLSSHPNDPEGGVIPFNDYGYPVIPMRWVAPGGVLEHIAYDTNYAVQHGASPASDPPQSLRLEAIPGTPTATVEEMIANCKEGVYVNRLSQVDSVPSSILGMRTGVTNGGCFLIRNGKIQKSIVNLRFVESPWLMFNRILAIGTTQRTARGYGGWPSPPTIAPPLMIQDFNFTALAAAV